MPYLKNDRPSPPPRRVKWRGRNRCSGGRVAVWRNQLQVRMLLTEETSSVDEVQRLLKQQLRFEVILLDAKHLPVMVGETTKDKLL